MYLLNFTSEQLLSTNKFFQLANITTLLQQICIFLCQLFINIINFDQITLQLFIIYILQYLLDNTILLLLTSNNNLLQLNKCVINLLHFILRKVQLLTNISILLLKIVNILNVFFINVIKFGNFSVKLVLDFTILLSKVINILS